MIRIGIADDEDLVRDGIAALLSNQQGMIVVATVSSAHEAVELAGSGAIDVLLLDLDLGDRGGLDALADIRARAARERTAAGSNAPTARVIVVSSFPEAEYAVRAVSAGAYGYIRKASDPALLVQAIRTVAAGGRSITPEVADLLADRASAGPSDPRHGLSDREHQILLLLGSGRSVVEIADELSLSPSSVSTYRRRILDKLDLPNTAAIIRYVASRGLA